MLKIQLICEHCGKTMEFKPEDGCEEVRVSDVLNESDFLIDSNNIEIENNSVLKTIRIDCTSCGNYIVLTAFDEL